MKTELLINMLIRAAWNLVRALNRNDKEQVEDAKENLRECLIFVESLKEKIIS